MGNYIGLIVLYRIPDRKHCTCSKLYVTPGNLIHKNDSEPDQARLQTPTTRLQRSMFHLRSYHIAYQQVPIKANLFFCKVEMHWNRYL